MLRVALLLGVLLVVALTSWQERYLATRWHDPLYVAIYPIAADDSPVTRGYLAALDAERFKAIDQFFAREAGRYHLDTGEPFRTRLRTELQVSARRTPACWRPPCGVCACDTGPGASAGMCANPRTFAFSCSITTPR
jgi:hypothetical protein